MLNKDERECLKAAQESFASSGDARNAYILAGAVTRLCDEIERLQADVNSREKEIQRLWRLHVLNMDLLHRISKSPPHRDPLSSEGQTIDEYRLSIALQREAAQAAGGE